MRLRSNLHLLDEDGFRKALESLAGARGLSFEWRETWECGDHALTKGLGAAGPDPVLEDLRRDASGHFEEWMRRLMENVKRVIGHEPTIPLSPADLAKLQREIQSHKIALVFNFTGTGATPEQVRTLQSLGLVEKWVNWPSEAARYGALLERVQQATAGEPVTSWTAWARQADPIPMTPVEKLAVRMAERSAGTYLTNIADATGQAVEESVLQAEKQIVQRRIVESIKARRGLSGTVSDLFWDTKAAGLNRDWERVARTEMAQALHEGRHAYIRATSPEPDPLVFKITRPGCCRECARIWRNQDGTPKLYRLSEVEAGGPNNVGRKQKEWIATIGPSHPNCSDSSLSRFQPGLTEQVFDKLRR